MQSSAQHGQGALLGQACLAADRDGFAIWYKRLEQGTFTLPVVHGRGGIIERRELSMLLEGVIPKKVGKLMILLPPFKPRAMEG